MKNKNIFRMTSVLLISIICVCGLSLNAYASDGGEYYSTVPTEETTNPPVIVIPDQSEDGEQTSEPIIIKPENAFTPDGNMTLIDNVEGEDEGQKQFIIVQSKNGHYFYIVIDYSTEGENTVHFLNQVDEADLMAILAEEEITLAPAECTCTDKCAVGDIDTTCPVCIAAMTDCAGAEATPNETDPPAGDEQPAPSGLNTGAIVGIVAIVILAGGGIFYYFKVLKPKQQKNKQPQGAELSEFEYDEYDEDEEYTEALEDIADEMNYDTDDTTDTEDTDE